jgi:hypothetical protein
MEADSPSPVTKSDLERASLVGADLDEYRNLRDSGVPHSLALRAMKDSDIDLPEFMRESAGLTRKQLADVATAAFVYKLPSTSDGWTFDLNHSNLMTMSYRLIRIGVNSEDAVEISLKTLGALKQCSGVAELDMDGIIDAVIAAGSVKIKLQVEWKVARQILRKWADSWFDSEGNPQFTDRANLLFEMNNVFLVPIEQMVQFLSLEFNDFDYLVDKLVGYVPEKGAPVEDPDEELTAFTPLDMLERYPDLFCSYLKNREWPTNETSGEVFDGILAFCEELLVLEGFDLSIGI